MSRDEAQVRFTADDREVERAWAKQFAQMDRLERKLDQAGRKAQASGDMGMKSFLGWAAGIFSASQALSAFVSHMERANQAQQQHNAQSAKTTRNWDEAFRKLGVQASVYGDDELAQLKTQVAAMSRKYAFSPLVGQRAATEMVSRGYDIREVVQGGALEEIFSFAAATNQAGGDPEEHIAALIKGLEAYGMDLSRENIRRAARGIQAGFKGTPLQASTFARSAEVLSGFKQMTGAEFEEATATMAVLSKTLGESKIATAMQNFGNYFATAAGQQEKVKALAMMRLRPHQVDFQGESYLEVLDTLAEAMERTRPEVFNTALAKVVGGENVSATLTLIRNRDEIRQRAIEIASPEAEAAYAKDVAFATSGEAADLRRAESRQEESQNRPGSTIVEAIATEIEAVGRERGWTGAQIANVQEAFRYNMANNLSPSEALSNAMIGQFAGKTGTQEAHALWKNLVTHVFADAPDLSEQERIQQGNEILSRNRPSVEEWERQNNEEPSATKVLAEAGRMFMEAAAMMKDAAQNQNQGGDRIILEVDGKQVPGKKVPQ